MTGRKKPFVSHTVRDDQPAAVNKKKLQVCRGYGDPHGYGYGVGMGIPMGMGMGIEMSSPRQPRENDSFATVDDI